jgi:hypothetical protein
MCASRRADLPRLRSALFSLKESPRSDKNRSAPRARKEGTVSRSGYSDYWDAEGNWEMICWRGAVKSAIRGKRGQAFLREMLQALDALPEKRLIAEDLVSEEGCCALGAVALQRGLDVSEIDPTDRDAVAKLFGIAGALAAETAYMNDEGRYYCSDETPEQRFSCMRAWVAAQIRE